MLDRSISRARLASQRALVGPSSVNRYCPAHITGLRHGSGASLEAGEGKTGHINAGPNEGVLFFNSKFDFYVLSCVASRIVTRKR